MEFSSDEDDVHVCGWCKKRLARLDDWLHHKRTKACKGDSFKIRKEPAGTRPVSGVPANAAKEDDADEEEEEEDGDADGNGEDEDEEDGSSNDNGNDNSSSGGADPNGKEDNAQSIITRNLFPIAPRIRKRERPGGGAVETASSSPGSAAYSPTAAAELGYPGSVKRKRGRPQKLEPLAAGAQLPAREAAAGMPLPRVSGGSAQLPKASAAATGGSCGGPTAAILPPVYKCEWCKKCFMKLSHLHRHMNKKKPCEPRRDSLSDDAGGGGRLNGISEGLGSSPVRAGGGDSVNADNCTTAAAPGTPRHGGASGAVCSSSACTALHGAAGSVAFRCGLCNLECGTYADVVRHHAEHQTIYYPGYCRFCGRYHDRKTKLLIHLATHTDSNIIEEVASEMKKIRQTKIERQAAAALAAAAAAIAGSSSRRASVLPLALAVPSACCAACSAFCENDQDLLVHHNDSHAPVGVRATLSDLRRGREGDAGADGNVSGRAHGEWKNCFVCCLKFADGDEFEEHIIYHRVWVSPPDRSSRSGVPVDDNVGISYGQAFLKEEQLPVTAVVSNGSFLRSPHASSTAISGAKLEAATSSHLDGSGNGHVNDHADVWQSDDDNPSSADGRSLICWLCKRLFSQYDTWRRHLSGEHALRSVYQCAHDQCRRTFDAWHELAAHSREHGQHAFVCAVCNRHNATRASLAAHAELHQSLGAPWYDAAHGGGANRSACGHCGLLLADAVRLEAHRDRCRRQYVVCGECGEEVRRSKMARHAQVSHADARRFACDLCSSAFPVKERLTQHVKNVHGPRKYVCHACGAAFKRSDKLKRHFSLHSDIRPFVCPHPSCRRGFKRADGLRAHARYHEAVDMGEAAATADLHTCAQCNESFESQAAYLRHRRKHNLEEEDTSSGPLYPNTAGATSDANEVLIP